MALTFQELRNLLTPGADGRLVIDASQLEAPSLLTLWHLLLPEGKLTLSQATSTPDEAARTITVSGTLAPGSLPGISQARLTGGVFSCLSDTTTAVLQLTVTDADWGLASTFPALTGTPAEAWELRNPILTLDSTATGLPTNYWQTLGYKEDPLSKETAKQLVPGLQLSAAVRLPESRLRTMLEQAKVSWPLAVSGPVMLYAFTDVKVSKETLLLPALLLKPAAPGGKVAVGNGELTCTPELAVVPLEVSAPKPDAAVVVPTPLVAVRAAYQPGPGWKPLELLARYYRPTAPDLVLETAEGIEEESDVSKLKELLQKADQLDALLKPSVDFPTVQAITLDQVRLYLGNNPFTLVSVSVAFGIGKNSKWELFGGLLKVDGLQLALAASQAQGRWQPTGAVIGQASFRGGPVLEAYFTVPTLQFQCTLTQPGTFDLGAAVRDLIGDSIGLPTYTGITFQLTGDVKEKKYTFETAIAEEWRLVGGENGLVLREINLMLGRDNGTPHGWISGVVTFAGTKLILSATYKKGEGWKFTGELKPKDKKSKLSLDALLRQLGQQFNYEMPALPTIDLNTLKVEYTHVPGKKDKSGLVIKAGLNLTGATIDLTGLPLVGSHLGSYDSIGLNSLTLEINTLDRSQLALNVQVGNQPYAVRIPLGGGPKQKKARLRGRAAAVADAPKELAPRPTVPQAGVWLDVQRTLGPLTVSKIGFALDQNGLAVLFNASLSFTAFKAEVLGLGARVALTAPHTVRFHIDGLSMSYSSAALSIAGAFMRTQRAEYVEFSGQLLIRAGDFAFALLGSYATTQPPSLFAFLMINAPMGGPPFFYLKGVAGGFGYNRNLGLPPIDEVARFPLVAGATKGASNPFSGKSSPLDVMQKYLGVEMGQTWLAAGLSVSSFGMLEASLLLSVAFGNRLQISLLGLGTYKSPALAEKPVISVELALAATVAPDAGELSVRAQLTSNSYLFDPSCRLTGGFAFCLWFGPSPHAGDFVLTLGGYNPNFKAPDHYPVVPLVGINWRVSDVLVIKGGAYFALTPRAIMAGGSLEAAWRSGPLSASFKLWADFLIHWKPFYYDIRLGVSFRVEASVKILIRITLRVSIGAQLHIWGPDFRYRAYIDLTIISFTIGDPEVDTKPGSIGWDAFKESFLTPGAEASRRALATPGRRRPAGGRGRAAAPKAGPAETVVNLLVREGVLQSLDEPHTLRGVPNGAVPPRYLVDPQRFELASQSQIPARSLEVNGRNEAGDWRTDFGIGPMHVTPERLLDSTHTVRIQRFETGKYVDCTDFVATPRRSRVAKGLWQHEANLNDNLNAPTQLDNVLDGVALTPQVPQGRAAQTVDAAVLRYGQEPARALPWGRNLAPTTDPFGADDPTATLVATIGTETAAGRTRAGILADLFRNGFDLDPSLRTAPLTNATELELLNPFVLSYLGESKG